MLRRSGYQGSGIASAVGRVERSTRLAPVTLQGLLVFTVKPIIVSPSGRLERGPEDRVIVSCGVESVYPERFTSMRAACDHWCSGCWRVYYTDYPDGCPRQAEHKYAFKIFAIREAEALGFRRILWLDAGMSPVGSTAPLWQCVNDAGWYVGYQDAERTGDGLGKLGNWCSDAALAVYGISREEALGVPLVRSGIVGLDLDHPLGAAIWKGWQDLYERGAFNGHHNNVPGSSRETPAASMKTSGHVSFDPRVRGHRHDESALAFVLHSLGLKPQNRGFLTLESKQTGFLRHWEAG